MKRKIEFIFMILVGFVIVFVLIIDIKNISIYEKLYKVYSKDPNYECTIAKKCEYETTTTFNNKQVKIEKELQFTHSNIFTQYFGMDDNNYYIINIKSNEYYYAATFNLTNNYKFYPPHSIGFRYQANDITYSGIYYLENESISIDLSPLHEIKDPANYHKHSKTIEQLCEFVTKKLLEDLKKYEK